MPSRYACPVCDETRRLLLYLTKDRYYNIAGEWIVAECIGCGLVQIDPMLTMDQFKPLYPSKFYAYTDQRRDETRKDEFVLSLKRKLFHSLQVDDPEFKCPDRLLDSGCGTGWALLRFQSSGWECVGVDPSNDAARLARELYGLDIRAGTVYIEKFPEGYFK